MYTAMSKWHALACWLHSHSEKKKKKVRFNVQNVSNRICTTYINIDIVYLTLAGMRVSPHCWFPWQVVVEVLTAFTVYTISVVFTDTLSMDLNMMSMKDSLLFFRNLLTIEEMKMSWAFLQEK